MPIAEFQLMYSQPGKKVFYIGLSFFRQRNKSRVEPPLNATSLLQSLSSEL